MGFRVRVDQGKKHSSRCGEPPERRSRSATFPLPTPAQAKFLKKRTARRPALRGTSSQRLANGGIKMCDSLARGDSELRSCRAGPWRSAWLTRLADILGEEFRQCAPHRSRAGRLSPRRLRRLADMHKANAQAQYLFVNGRPVRDSCSLARCARLTWIMCRRGAIRPLSCSSIAIRARSMSMSIRPRRKCAFVILALRGGLVIGALKQSLAIGAPARDSKRMRDCARLFRTACRQRRRGARLSRARRRLGLAANPRPIRVFAESAPPDIGDLALIGETLAADTRAHAQAPAPEDSDAPLGAARRKSTIAISSPQTRDGLVIVDQHARMSALCMKLLKAARAGRNVPRQVLLIPAIVEMEQADVERIEDALPLLQEFVSTLRLSGQAQSRS